MYDNDIIQGILSQYALLHINYLYSLCFSDGISVVYEIHLWITSLIYKKLCGRRRLDLLL